MKYCDYFLQAADEKTMQSALRLARVTDEDDNLIPGHYVDVIGTWSEITGGTDEEPIITKRDGWHFNVRTEREIEWSGGVTLKDPNTPWRVWG